MVKSQSYFFNLYFIFKQSESSHLSRVCYVWFVSCSAKYFEVIKVVNLGRVQSLYNTWPSPYCISYRKIYLFIYLRSCIILQEFASIFYFFPCPPLTWPAVTQCFIRKESIKRWLLSFLGLLVFPVHVYNESNKFS